MAPANGPPHPLIGRPKDSWKLYGLKLTQKKAEYEIHRSCIDLAEGTKDEYLASIGLVPSMPKGMHRKIVGLGMERMVKTVRNKQQGHQKEPSKAAIVKKPNKKLEIRGKEGGGRIANGKIVKYSQAPNFVPKVLPAERIHTQQKKERANPPNPPNTKSEGKGRIAHIPKAQHFPHSTKNEESFVAVNSFIRKQLEISWKYAQLNKTANAINGIGHSGTVFNGPSKFSWRETSPGTDKENIGNNNNGPLKREDSNGNGGGGHPWP